MDDSLVEIEPGLAHHKKAWSQHDLLASTLSEYVNVLRKNGGRWPAWQVASSDETIHDDLIKLNAHLEKLGWMGKLTQDEEWVITVFPAPERQFPRMNSVLMFWGLSLLTLTLAGDHWMSNARPTEGWFHSSSLIDALLGYTLPVLLVLLVASQIQRNVAARYGVRSGHLMPVPDFTIALYALGLFPSSWLFWPFGLLLIPTMPRMDARPWPDRASIGFTALTVPLVLGFAGVIMMLMGLSMTPEYLASNAMPLVSVPPLFISLFAEPLLGNDAFIRLLWAHPWVHAGGMLMLFAWVSMLPIPTFPGGRLLIARMGLLDARSSSTQSLILVATLFCAYVFGVFEQFSLWFLVFALLLPLLFFFGTDLRIPLLLDETNGLSEADHGRMGLLLLLVFLLLLPAAQPVLHESTWDDPLTHELNAPETAILQEDGMWLSSTEIRITNPSALAKSFAVGAFLERPGQGWTVSWDCDGETTYNLNGQGCGSDLLPKRTAFFWMNLTWDAPTQPTLANLSYVVSMNDDYEVVETHVRPALEVVPSTHWYDVPAGAYVHRCIDLHGSLLNSTYLSMSVEASNIDGLQTQLVSAVDGVGLEQNMTDVPETFCLEGLDPLVFESSMGALTINNDTFLPQLPERRALVGHVPEEGWLIHAEDGQSWEALLGEGGVLSMDADHCPINSSISTPARPQDGSAWIWDTKVRTSGDIPLIESNQNLTLLMSEGANMSLCKDLFNPYPSITFPVVEGPELMVSWMGTTSRFWTTPWAIATNGTVLNTGMTSFTIHNPNNISVPLRLDRGGSFGEDWGHNWDGDFLAPGDTSFELTPPSAPLATMWLSYEAGAVVLHLSSYQ
ncbi:MAG: hypothetical protein DWC05_02450 [Candidatus Poseidoniales archaeon]|nr:MAG: hypothetical protein DWC05_02450 [Candidatus Poseidoniales archaeon]